MSRASRSKVLYVSCVRYKIRRPHACGPGRSSYLDFLLLQPEKLDTGVMREIMRDKLGLLSRIIVSEAGASVDSSASSGAAQFYIIQFSSQLVRNVPIDLRVFRRLGYSRSIVCYDADGPDTGRRD